MHLFTFQHANSWDLVCVGQTTGKSQWAADPANAKCFGSITLCAFWERSCFCTVLRSVLSEERRMVILSQELREAAQKIAFFQYESEKGFSPLNGSDGWNNRGHHEEQSQDAQMFPAGSKIAVESWNCLNFPYDRRDATGWHSEGQRKLEQDF